MAERLIHALEAGGGWLALGPLPLDGDAARLADWGATLVLSMTPRPEMDGLGAGDLPQALGRVGVDWMNLPIPDFGAPEGETAALWPLASVTARQVLGGGGRVFVHCRGGCGRSGMAVLRLMVELGEDPDAALERLRQVRPCAVETAAQLSWARSAAGE